MVEAIKKQFRVQWKDWLWMLLFEAIGWVAGVILFYVIMRTSGEDTYFAMGTVMGGLVAVIYSMIQMLVMTAVHFNVQIAMGVTRRRFFVSFYLVSFAANLISVGFLILINLLENGLNTVLYAGLTEEINFLPYLLRWGAAAAAVLPVLGGFCGALVMRFGKVAFWILWALWMILCLGGPGVEEAMENSPHTLAGQIGRIVGKVLAAVPANAWLVLLAVGSIGALAGTWVILRRQQVAG